MFTFETTNGSRETGSGLVFFYKPIHLLQGTLIFLAKFNVYFKT